MHKNKAKYTRISSKSLLKMRDTGYYAKYLERQTHDESLSMMTHITT
jgi:hypothetical protein